MTELANAESLALAEHEAVIERGLNTFVEVGTALLAIREGRLYRAEHSTFEEYTEQRWQLSRRRAYQLIEAASSVKNFTHDEDAPRPNESQARELARVPEKQRAEVWRETVERTEGKPTAAAVRETYSPPPETELTPRSTRPDMLSDDDLAELNGATPPAKPALEPKPARERATAPRVDVVATINRVLSRANEAADAADHITANHLKNRAGEAATWSRNLARHMQSLTRLLTLMEGTTDA